MIRLLAFAAALLASAVLVSIGVAAYSRPAGLIAGGALLAAWSWAVLSTEPDDR